MSASLADVGGLLGIAVPGDASATLVGATHDSRAVQPGWLFCCVPGANVDGHEFAPAAIAAGAAALLVERPLGLGVPELQVRDVRRAMGPVAAVIEGQPSNELTVVGVTGTNGKSSVVQLLADIWAAAGTSAEIYGTLTGARTTPEATDLQRQFRQSRDRGVDAVAIEVSSHALALERTRGTRFAAAIFTNLGRDHLDFHRTMENYFAAKTLLFAPGYTPLAVVNTDDDYGLRLAGMLRDESAVTLHRYELRDAEGLVIDGVRSTFTWRGHPVSLPLAGRHNVSNALAAATAAAAIGLDPEVIVAGLEATAPVRGRFELVANDGPFTVAVDYAHTPDALEAVLGAATQMTAGRVIVVFGCGGDRDREKRPEMGKVAQRTADVVVVTSDNPRREDPLDIIDAILNGMDLDHDTNVIVEADRRVAIERAIAEAHPGDIVVIAGKGHEAVQVIQHRELPFDDRQVVLDALGARA
ncbi:MAG: UDP-N-acetylmuramoyl-L-alanyl-D-glutamate--2,6-diaminopimelate ligase [Actinomycetota bacterium]